MDNIKILERSDQSKPIKIKSSNLWSDVCFSKNDIQFWIDHFKNTRVPFVAAQFDTTMVNSQNQKMYRRVYGIFIDMKIWETKNV